MQRTESKVIYNKTIIPATGFHWINVILFLLEICKLYISRSINDLKVSIEIILNI